MSYRKRFGFDNMDLLFWEIEPKGLTPTVVNTSWPKAAEEIIFDSFRFNGTGNAEMAVDGSTEKVFDVICPIDQRYLINNINFLIKDDDAITLNFIPDNFGGISSLTNGVKLEVLNIANSGLLDLTGDSPLKNNSDIFALSGGDMTFFNTTLSSSLLFNINFNKLGFGLLLESLQKIRVTIRDNISISSFRGLVQGFIL